MTTATPLADDLTRLSAVELHQQIGRAQYLIRAASDHTEAVVAAYGLGSMANAVAALTRLLDERDRRRALAATPQGAPQPLTALRVGDVVTHIVCRGGDVIRLEHPRMVLREFGTIDPVTEVKGVRMHAPGEVEYVLYPDSLDAVYVGSRQRGYASVEAAARVARKVVGWSTNGGWYFYPLPGSMAARGYMQWGGCGFQGIDEFVKRARRNGWIVQSGARWYVTQQAHVRAANVIREDAEVSLAVEAAALVEASGMSPHFCYPACADRHRTRLDDASDAAEVCTAPEHVRFHDTRVEDVSTHVVLHLAALTPIPAEEV